jgi:hypothetical protein
VLQILAVERDAGRLEQRRIASSLHERPGAGEDHEAGLAGLANELTRQEHTATAGPEQPAARVVLAGRRPVPLPAHLLPRAVGQSHRDVQKRDVAASLAVLDALAARARHDDDGEQEGAAHTRFFGTLAAGPDLGRKAAWSRSTPGPSCSKRPGLIPATRPDWAAVRD